MDGPRTYSANDLPDTHSDWGNREVDAWDEIVAACRDEMDRAIVTLKRGGFLNQTIALLLHTSNSTITNRLKAIWGRVAK